MLPGRRTDTGAIYVTQGPPPAGTPLVGGIAVSQDGAIYVSQAFTPPFSPLDLFASGEQGVWYDPSDLSTMFQDSAGTTPVTADGQPVGLILDKSKGLVLGPELVTNGDFSNGTVDWLPVGTGTQEIVSGEMKLTITGSEYKAVNQTPFPTVPGKWYELSAKIRAFTSAGIVSDRGRIQIVGGINTFLLAETSGDFTVSKIWLATGTLIDIECGVASSGAWGAPGDYCLFDNISIKELPGNHASQASAAKRPLLQNDGVNNYLAFDGVDDWLGTSSNPITGATGASEWHGASVTSFTSNTGLINELGSSSSTTHEPYSDGDFYSAFVNDTRPLCGAIGVSAGEKYVMFEKQSATTHSWRMNGTDKADSSCAFSLSTSALSIGKDTRSVGWHGIMYSLIILGRLATTQEITDTETWVAGKTGVVLP